MLGIRLSLEAKKEKVRLFQDINMERFIFGVEKREFERIVWCGKWESGMTNWHRKLELKMTSWCKKQEFEMTAKATHHKLPIPSHNGRVCTASSFKAYSKVYSAKPVEIIGQGENGIGFRN